MGQGSCIVAGTVVWTTRGLRRIETLRAGDVVLTYPDGPPLGVATRPAAAIDPSRFRLLTLALKKSPTQQINIHLLRSLDWIEDYGAHVGGSVFLDMPEMGAEGLAEVLSIEPCPEIEAGAGRIVTGTFAHTSGEVCVLPVSVQELVL